ncbi:hypothetical protein D3C73_1397030 [compost metagenome]
MLSPRLSRNVLGNHLAVIKPNSGQLDEVWLESLPKVGYIFFHDSYDECKAGETPAFYSFFGSDISIKRGPDLHGIALYNQ